MYKNTILGNNCNVNIKERICLKAYYEEIKRI